MNVVIPLGGVGSRFQTEGYLTRPKPFIPILGKPMLLWVIDNLSLQPDDTLVIIYNPSWMNMDRFMEEIVAAKYPRCRLVELPGPTRGAAETVLIGLRAIPKSERHRPTLLADGDTFYTADVVGRFRKVSATHNAVFCFNDVQPKPMYSYISMDTNDNISEVKEKLKISDWANTGCYCFRNGEELAKECEALIVKGETQLSQDQKGEFYTSGVIAAMIGQGAPFRAIKLVRDDFHVLGTPSQVAEWCASWPNQPKLHFVFDLDGTLMSAPQVPGDFATCQPVARNARLCRRLKAQGHHVTIWTERISDRVGVMTLDSLRSHGIEYDEVLFGKPRADFFIDDKCADPILGDLDKQIGFYPASAKVQEPNRGVASAALQVGGAVAPLMPSKDGLIGLAIGLVLGVSFGVAVSSRRRWV